MTDDETSRIAKFLCREFYCASAFCRECHPGSRAYEAAESILGIVADFRPPVGPHKPDMQTIEKP